MEFCRKNIYYQRNVHDAVVSRIKILASLKIDEKRVPQDGRFFFSVDGNDVDLRISTLPTTYGEKVVIASFAKISKSANVARLGFERFGFEKFDECNSSDRTELLLFAVLLFW